MDSYIAGMLYGDGTKFLGKNRAYAVTVDQHIKNKDISDFLKKKSDYELLKRERFLFVGEEP